MNPDQHFMQLALEQAQQAQQYDEVPVGALVVMNDKIIGTGYNQPIGNHDCTAHAEIMALRNACQYQQNYRLIGASLYVTLEPCMMCLGAMVHARIDRLIFGASDPKTGVTGGCCDLNTLPHLNHSITVTGGILQKECSQILRDFFARRR